METVATKPIGMGSKIVWAVIAMIGACCLAVVALRRGEPVNAIWIVAASIAVFLIGYRFYGRFIENYVLRMDPGRAPPSVLRNDGLDYVPTDKWVVFGHHFAAIAGAGPLVGPVLAAQMGYLPGTLWILFGVVFAGAVQDFMVLGLSVRRDARSLGHMLREELGPLAGVVAMFGLLALMMIVLAVLALVVVKALTHSPWGTFSVACTIPIALLMGVYLRWFRPGRILEVSIIGLVLLLGSIAYGAHVAATPELASFFDFDAKALAWLLIGYGFFASVLPVWLLLAPRDYLSTFLKIGTILLHRPRLPGAVIPVPVHHHCLWLGVGLAFDHRIGHHTEAAFQRRRSAHGGLRWHADGGVRRHHGVDRRVIVASGCLFLDERTVGIDRHHARTRCRGDQSVGFRRHTG
jgi:hypothetical protein